ncbi:hypothetical protein L1987_63063 [Smallanthus sonchifolius]|uniref:Uncharacterized protein n=1 Tax=Smallanthus sonchifolius TaxID=185202 RepID=A0ACB9CC93_9ASTR|nr:hypothetical protein L1987_63063 [Smallanthus sonchifolius]
MSESPAKVRLVRCPKCENLLPEVTDYAVYQCGGCGAILRGKVISLFLRNTDVGLGSSSRRPEKDDNNMDFEEPRSRRSVWASNWRYREPDLQEGSSNYHHAPRHEYAELVQNINDLEVDDDRAELLRKLDELKYEIVRSRSNTHNIPSHMQQKNHPSIANSNQVQVFSGPFGSQNHRRSPIMPFEQNPYHPYYSGQFVSSGMTDNRLFHQPSCSCLACYSKHQQTPPPPPLLPPPPIAPPDMQNDPIYYHHYYNSQFSKQSTNSHSSEPHTRWSSEIRRPPRGILATGVRRCGTVGGGSPFVACSNCFELLQVPNKKTKKMRCAACSEVMLVSVVNKRLVLSVYTETNKYHDKSKYDHKTRGDAKWGGTEFSSEDFDNSGDFDFESMDKLPVRGPSLTSYKSAVSYVSEDEIKINIILDENPVDVVVNASKPSPPPSGSALQDHFDYSTKYNRAGKGNVSRRSEMELDEKPVNLGSHGTSMKDAAEASEIEISPNEYCINTVTSQESGDTSRETDQQRGSGSFFVGMVKKSFREFSRSGQHVDQGTVNVTVNGHPIPDRLVKKAENLAGTVQPGDYWYDSKAGFWGMMGGPCRGIIPPFIEEFNYPMLEKCADGNTNVFVNGRELHQRDLDLLVSRGLPMDADRSYLIDISGKVFDEDSGLELEGLGKLAPTVERKKHGFGMKPPRTSDV